jgi:hypothetical protein
MNRREFITLLGGAAAWPLAARAQKGDRVVRRIGVLMAYDGNDPEGKRRYSAFTQALTDLGWADGRNVRMDLRWAGGDSNRIRDRAGVGRLATRHHPDRRVGDHRRTTGDADYPDRLCGHERPPSPTASSPGLTDRVETSPALPTTKPRWEASGLVCSPRLLPP